MVITEQMRAEFLKDEFMLLQDWFDKYDQIIFKARGIMTTLFVALLGLAIDKDWLELTKLFIGVTIFFYLFEMFWLYRYWSPRTVRYQLIQRAFNENTQDSSIMTIFDPTNSHNSEKDSRPIRMYVWLKKCDEPTLFYSGVVVGALIVQILI